MHTHIKIWFTISKIRVWQEGPFRQTWFRIAMGLKLPHRTINRYSNRHNNLNSARLTSLDTFQARKALAQPWVTALNPKVNRRVVSNLRSSHLQIIVMRSMTSVRLGAMIATWKRLINCSIPIWRRRVVIFPQLALELPTLSSSSSLMVNQRPFTMKAFAAATLQVS